ncbi:DUF2786 domain-containing protein [Actinomadura keratinilytica]|uniref:DUF2786 domain-containing protein n=1 Tax=Actinomadura keratinilytica TaxID=547461 RepID=UPI0036061F07
MVDALMARALRALSRRDPAAFRACVAELAACGERPVDRLLPARLQEAATAAWHRGWQPADVARFTARTLGARHRRLVVDVIAAESRAYPAATTDAGWRGQLAALDARVWWTRDEELPRGWRRREGADRAEVLACALEVLHLLGALPRLPKIAPLPGEPSAAAGPVDERMLAKVRALLAKAESTEFPEEAEALSARAQELMARHSIDRALPAARADGAAAAAGPAGRRLAVDAPYESPKAALLTVVAEANGCRAVWHRELGFSTVLGFPADLAAVEMMFTSLLVQATAAMVRAGARRDAGDDPVRARSGTPSSTPTPPASANGCATPPTGPPRPRTRPRTGPRTPTGPPSASTGPRARGTRRCPLWPPGTAPSTRPSTSCSRTSPEAAPARSPTTRAGWPAAPPPTWRGWPRAARSPTAAADAAPGGVAAGRARPPRHHRCAGTFDRALPRGGAGAGGQPFLRRVLPPRPRSGTPASLRML